MKKIDKIRKSSVSYIREIQTTYRALDTERIKISSPASVVDFLQEMIGSASREIFVVLCVNNKNDIVNYYPVSIGTATEAVVHPREVFYTAVDSAASGIIVAHNHPSGTLEPSRQDIQTTERLKEAGKIMGIPLLDHIIVAFDNGYYSMKEHGHV
jgi:DNA repair protein RadC